MIEADGLIKHYRGGGPRDGLNGLDLAVSRGSVLGLLGPNGAGKSTAVRVLCTLLRPDGGTARVAGLDTRTHGAQVRAAIGLVGQHTAVDDRMSARANLLLIGRLSHLGGATAARVEELLERLGLAGAGGKTVGTFSGGMRRRLDIAASLLARPAVLFVDEPTTGLDPAGRQEVWALIRELSEGGATVLLTTQYLEEADALADRVVMMRGGVAVAAGTPTELKSSVGQDIIEIDLESTDVARVAAIAGRLGAVESDASTGLVRVRVADRVAALLDLSTQLHRQGMVPKDIRLRTPSLDDAFLAIAGSKAAA